MVQDGQQVSGGRAAAATLTAPALALVLIVGGGVGWFYYAMSSMNAAMAAMSGTGMINSAIYTHALTNQGYGPKHASELIVGGMVAGYDFVDYSNLTSTTDVPVDTVTLSAFDASGTSAQQGYANAAAAALPPNVVAHRLGDFVFTYHGIDVNDAMMNHRGLWLVILSPDPDVNGSISADPIEVGLADGTLFTFPASDLNNQITQQNQLRRAAYGLPPLPNPETVTHDQPAPALDRGL